MKNAGLTIHSDTAGSAAPGILPKIDLTDTQITGIAGGTIHFSDLTQSYSPVTEDSGTNSNQFPGLVVRFASYGGESVEVDNTLATCITQLNTETNGINDLTVLGTTGVLQTGLLQIGSDTFPGALGEFSTFAAKSVTIGNGLLSSVAGAVDFSLGTSIGQLTIDDRSDTTSRSVTVTPVPTTAYYALAGLSNAVININSGLSFNEVDIYGVAGSQYSFEWAPLNTRLYAGEGSSVELTGSSRSNVIPPVSIFGAASVLIDPQNNPTYATGSTAYIAPDPSRPNDTTNLTIDFTKFFPGGLSLGRVSNGVYGITPGGGLLPITYQGATTIVTLEFDPGPFTFPFTVNDTGSAGTTISLGGFPLNIQGTDGPLTLEQGGAGAVTFGNSGSLSGINGAVSILANNSVLPPIPLTFDDSADATSKTVTIAQDMSGNSTISGELALLIPITGSQFTLNLKGGTGNNQLIAPNVVDDWQVNGANSGVLNRTITFSGFGNLQSGNQNDSIFFKPGGSLTGNLDGGPGTDIVLSGRNADRLRRDQLAGSHRAARQWPSAEYRIVEHVRRVDDFQSGHAQSSS